MNLCLATTIGWPHFDERASERNSRKQKSNLLQRQRTFCISFDLSYLLWSCLRRFRNEKKWKTLRGGKFFLFQWTRARVEDENLIIQTRNWKILCPFMCFRMRRWAALCTSVCTTALVQWMENLKPDYEKNQRSLLLLACCVQLLNVNRKSFLPLCSSLLFQEYSLILCLVFINSIILRNLFLSKQWKLSTAGATTKTQNN